jgi:hypothetical protein
MQCGGLKLSNSFCFVMNFGETVCRASRWKEVLQGIQVKAEHVTEDLVAALAAYEFDASSLTRRSFAGYFQGVDELEAGMAVAKDFSMIDGVGDFMESAISWSTAWRNLKKEGYVLVRVNEPCLWALFVKDPG